MSRVWRYVLTAALAVIGEITVSVIANSVTISKRYYLAPLGAFIALVSIMATVDYYRNEMPARSSAVSLLSSPVPGHGVTLRGKRQHDSKGLSLAALWFFIMYLAIVIGATAGRSNFGAHKVPVEITCYAIAAVTAALFIRLCIGVRATVQFSREGVTIRDGRRRFSVRWNDTTNISTDSTFWGGTWLLATLPASSPLVYLPPTSKIYDPKKEVLKLCDLARAGINKHEVDGALENFDPGW